VGFLYLVIAALLVALNAFFVASEFAIVKVRRTRLEELAGQGVSAARVSILCVDQMDEYLSATQLGITIVSLGLGWIGEEAIFGILIMIFPALEGGGYAPYHVVAAGISFSIITLLHVVLGELVPKSMAIQRADRIALKVSRPLHVFYRVAQPLIQMFNALANFVLRRLGFNTGEEPPISEEELKLVMKESREDGVISESEAQIIHRAFEFSDKRAIDIMIPAERVEVLSLTKSFDENLSATRGRMHSRFPLTRDGLDSIVGIVHMKDVLYRLKGSPTNKVFEESARPAVFVDPGVGEDRLMRLFKEQHTHLAVVRDPRTKRNLGIVTLEDILEELVGEIADEHGH